MMIFLTDIQFFADPHETQVVKNLHLESKLLESFFQSLSIFASSFALRIMNEMFMVEYHCNSPFGVTHVVLENKIYRWQFKARIDLPRHSSHRAPGEKLDNAQQKSGKKKSKFSQSTKRKIFITGNGSQHEIKFLLLHSCTHDFCHSSNAGVQLQ